MDNLEYRRGGRFKTKMLAWGIVGAILLLGFLMGMLNVPKAYISLGRIVLVSGIIIAYGASMLLKRGKRKDYLEARVDLAGQNTMALDCIADFRNAPSLAAMGQARVSLLLTDNSLEIRNPGYHGVLLDLPWDQIQHYKMTDKYVSKGMLVGNERLDGVDLTTKHGLISLYQRPYESRREHRHGVSAHYDTTVTVGTQFRRKLIQELMNRVKHPDQLPQPDKIPDWAVPRRPIAEEVRPVPIVNPDQAVQYPEPGGEKKTGWV